MSLPPQAPSVAHTAKSGASFLVKVSVVFIRIKELTSLARDGPSGSCRSHSQAADALRAD
jgi:hypothetical protein